MRIKFLRKKRELGEGWVAELNCVCRLVVNELDNVLRGSGWEKDLGDAGLLEGGNVGFGNDASDEDGDVVHAFFVKQFHKLGADGVVRAGEDGEADDVDVFLYGGGGNHLGR